MPVTVVSDTTHYLPAATVADAGIVEVSLYVNEGATTTRESEMESFQPFYDRLGAAKDLPTTSQPSVGDFLAAYEPLLAAGQDIVSVHIAGGISGTIESARAAAAEAQAAHPGRRIEVVDSRSAAGGLALVVLAAAAAAQGGHDVDAVAARATAAAEQVHIWFAVETLEFLRRGGRIGAAQAWLGGTLKIKPILTFGDEVTPVERVRTSRRAFERMVELAGELRDRGCDAWMVQHIQDPERCEQLVDRCREVFGTEPVAVSELGAVLGTHAGPGLLGVGGLPSALLAR